MSSKAPAAGKQSIAPNQTLYVRNLPDKLKKPDLRRQLYLLFSTYGSVLDIVALKTSKMRGQAHITYKDIQTAAQAMRNLDGFEFFDRKISISYAKSKSDFVAKLDGTFQLPAFSGDKQSDAAAVAGEKGTALQQSVFGGPPPSAAQSGAQSLKRGREDEEQGDLAMEEDEEDMEMDESDDD